MKFVIDLSVYRSAERGGVNSLKTLLAIQSRKNCIVVLSHNASRALFNICMSENCSPQVRTWFVNMRSEKRFFCENAGTKHLYNTLQSQFDVDTWAIIKNDLDNVVLALKHEDKIILFSRNFSQGCSILSRHAHPILNSILWKDTTLPDTANWIDEH